MKLADAKTDDTARARGEFERLLARAGRQWRIGSWGCIALRVCAALSLALPVLCVLDLIFAWPEDARAGTGLSVLAVLIGLGLWRAVRVLSARPEDVACHLDRLLADPRRPVLSALELLKDPEGAAGLRAYLVERSLARARERTAELPPTRVAEAGRVKQRLRRTLKVVAGTLVVLLAAWPFSRVLVLRVLAPYRDIPPYSHLAFEVRPQDAKVVYGESLELSTSVSGAGPGAAVELVTRDEATVRTAACFERGDGVYSQRLTDVVQPVEFCFRSGRARSRWHRVSVLYEPRITGATCRVRPPDYTGLPETGASLSDGAVSVLPGSVLTLAVTCNRPLASCRAEGTAAAEGAAGSTFEVEGRVGTMHEAAFEWDVQVEADVSVIVRDVQGTPVRTPFTFRQLLRPDHPPAVAIVSPGEHVLATPTATLTLAVEARDDLGLERLTLVRSVVGYRDRFLPLPTTPGTRTVDHSMPLDLAHLGVAAGDMLEFYAEAGDRNPAQTGLATSEVARVQVISEEEYAQMLRVRTTMDEFAARYRRARDAWNRFRDAVDAMEEAREAGADQERLEALAREAEKRANEAASLFEALAEDFAIYDVENQFRPVLAEAAADMRRAERMLQHLTAAPQDLPYDAAVRDLKRITAERTAEIDTMAMSAAEIAAVGRAMRCAGVYRKIVEDQRRLVRQLEAFTGAAGRRDPALLALLGRRQEELRERLVAFMEELSDAVEALPEGYPDLVSSAREFLRLLEAVDPGEPMASAATAAAARRAQEAWEQAGEALRRLEQLLSDSNCSGFAGLCSGSLRFSVPRDLASTMQQLMAAMLASGQGMGSDIGGSGTGIAGTGGGERLGGGFGLVTPVYGPTRMVGGTSSALSGDGNQGWGRGGDGGAATAVGHEAYSASDQRVSRDSMSPQDLVPVRYRDAVRRYFSSSGLTADGEVAEP